MLIIVPTSYLNIQSYKIISLTTKMLIKQKIGKQCHSKKNIEKKSYSVEGVRLLRFLRGQKYGKSKKNYLQL